MDAARAILDWLRTRSKAERSALARAATSRARELGLVFLRPDGAFDIPLALSPVVTSEADLARRALDAHALLGAVVKAARHLLDGSAGEERTAVVFRHLGPLERSCLAKGPAAEDVTIARVDWFLDAAGGHHALELNATIPAMQTYSDAAQRAFLLTLGEAARLSPETVERLVAANGSNQEDLRRSIVAHAGLADDRHPSIALVHREGDAQIRELEALAQAFRAAGHRARCATPSEISLAPDRTARVGGEPVDLLYRHIFARRIPEGSPLEEIALGRSTTPLLNPVNAHLEVKGVLAELKRLVTEQGGSGLGLTELEREVVERVVPWTRLFEPGPATGPDGSRHPDLVALVRAAPARFVVKRSWDYGGKSVFIGRDTFARDGENGWNRQLDSALAQGPGAFVVQELIETPRQRHLIVAAEGETALEEVFVDASTYTASGTKAVPQGSVARFSRGGIVNIVGGGGVAPLVREPVARAIAEAL